jgi:hypothetical protein
MALFVLVVSAERCCSEVQGPKWQHPTERSKTCKPLPGSTAAPFSTPTQLKPYSLHTPLSPAHATGQQGLLPLLLLLGAAQRLQQGCLTCRLPVAVASTARAVMLGAATAVTCAVGPAQRGAVKRQIVCCCCASDKRDAGGSLCSLAAVVGRSVELPYCDMSNVEHKLL